MFGRARPQPDQTERRLADLERQNQDLRAELDALQVKQDQAPGVVEDRKDWFVVVGGQRVDLQAIPPIEWVRSMEELPSFLWQFAVDRTASNGQLTEETLNKVLEVAKRWITASAISLEGIDLDRLTLPEAEHAVSHISELNGVTAQLRTWFRNQLGLAGTAQGSEALRRSPERAARHKN